MQFISYSFLLFFPAVILINFLLPVKVRRIWVLLSSYFFYSCLRPVLGLFLVLVTLIGYFSGLVLGKGRKNSLPAKKQHTALVFCVCLHLALLAVLKYTGMAVSTFSALSSAAGLQTSFSAPGILLPAGISFYMLQSLGYCIDVYRGSIEEEHDLLGFALFVSFFPCVLSGPIERAGHMLPQFAAPPSFRYENMRDGLLRMVWGFFLKLVLAGRLAVITDTVFGDPGNYSGGILAAAALLYTFQIYCDFDGYTNIAIGAARVLGYELTENFRAPYLSASVGEFWRRWHISLSYWFRDYLYIPLGGNRRGTLRKYLNILVVFAVSGLWHGAGWTFVFWGALHGLYQVAGFLLRPVRDFFVRLFRIDRGSFSHRLASVALTFFLVSFAWIFFRSPDLKTAFQIVRGLGSFEPWVLSDGSLYGLGLDAANFNLMLIALCVRIAVDLCTRRGIVLRNVITSQAIWLRWLIYISAVILILLCGMWGPGYNAGSFIYAQF
ncbi:MAG: MBOAT family protein [Lachnospiraceae bacterium]|jgi:alginate O-acetyltransferase complex protein AlgI|nr:MBOAT family protein [Lachnospiraceae bacterium]